MLKLRNHFRLVLLVYWFISLQTCCCLARILRCSLIWSRHCLDASTAFLSGQCVYIWVKVEYHKIIWVGMAYKTFTESVGLWILVRIRVLLRQEIYRDGLKRNKQKHLKSLHNLVLVIVNFILRQSLVTLHHYVTARYFYEWNFLLAS